MTEELLQVPKGKLESPDIPDREAIDLVSSAGVFLWADEA